jgi:hypothetical protein
MRKRPWEILVLTLVYALAPVGNLAFTCLVRGYSLADLPALVLALGPLDWVGLAVYPALAVAVWSVSLPGWWVFLGLNLGLLALNVWQGSLVPGANLALVVLADLANVAVASLLFFPHARSPYFSPRLRWWNAEVRYRVVYVLDVPVRLRQEGAEATGHLLDLSLTGCFVDLPPDFALGKAVDLEFECWGLTVSARGRILRHSPPGGELEGYGIQFVGLSADQRHHIRSLVMTLKAHQVPLREERILLDSGQGPGLLRGGSPSEGADASLR